MTTTSNVLFCPRCSTEILSAADERCKSCDYILSHHKAKHFQNPKYLSTQLEDYQLSLSAIHRTAGSKPPTKEEQTRLADIEEDFRLHLIRMHPRDRTKALQDALDSLRFVTSSEAIGEDLKTLISLGKRIGELAAAIENYVKAGGGLLHARRTTGTLGGVRADDQHLHSSTATAR